MGRLLARNDPRDALGMGLSVTADARNGAPATSLSRFGADLSSRIFAEFQTYLIRHALSKPVLDMVYTQAVR
jgi:hypothetical protein